jgi:uncharacterized membrane protein YtjA (UPF0391 family)
MERECASWAIGYGQAIVAFACHQPVETATQLRDQRPHFSTGQLLATLHRLGTPIAVLRSPANNPSRRAAPATSRRFQLNQPSTGGGPMLRYAAIFFVIAIIAALFGFGGIAAGATEIAKVLFFIFVVIFLITLLMGVMRR